MNRFVRYVFLLLLLSSAVAIALVLVSDLRAENERQKNLNIERGLIADTYRRMDCQDGQIKMHGLMTVERQETVMNPESKQSEVATTTLLFAMTDEKFSTPTYVQRIVIPGGVVRVSAIKLEFGAALGGEQALLAGHKFYLPDTIGGITDPDPFELNPVGCPPLALRHSAPDFTEYEKQLWHPIWEGVGPGSRPAAKGQGVERLEIEPATVAVEPDRLYRVRVGVHVGPKIGVGIEDLGATGSPDVSSVMYAMLRLALVQDEEVRTGIKAVPAGDAQPAKP